MLGQLQLRLAVGLFKLNNSMNIAGLRREIPVYAAPTDTHSGMPTNGIGGTIITSPLADRLQPSRYRFKALLERAKQLVGVAQQMEASYLSFLDKQDQETYTLFRAQQDLEIANQHVTLQDLRFDEATHQEELAQLQLEKVEYIKAHYENLIDEGWLAEEGWAVGLLWGAAAAQGVLTLTGALAGACCWRCVFRRYCRSTCRCSWWCCWNDNRRNCYRRTNIIHYQFGFVHAGQL